MCLLKLYSACLVFYNQKVNTLGEVIASSFFSSTFQTSLPFHGCFEITFSQLTLHDLDGRQDFFFILFFAVLQLFKHSRSHDISFHWAV